MNFLAHDFLCDQIGRMDDSTHLETLLADLALRSTNEGNVSFATLVEELSMTIGAELVFNVRVDSDPAIQRIACLAVDECSHVLIMLDVSGHQIASASIHDNIPEDFLSPLKDWELLPLHCKAQTKVDAPVALLIGALRNLGHLPSVE